MEPGMEQKMDLVIKNGTVVTAEGSMRADVGILDGKIAAVASTIEGGTEVIDASGMYVCPGGVEIHTHIDGILHGMRTVDDWYDASVGAAFGGTTTVVDYPIQNPGQTLHEVVDERVNAAAGKSIVDFAFTPVVTQFNEETFAELPALIEEGVPTYKVFMFYDWKIDDFNLARIMDVVGHNGGLVGIHCENAGTIDYLSQKAIANGQKGPEWHAPTRPVSTEVEATSRVLYLAEELGVPVLIVHMSAAPAVEELAKFRARGVSAYGETMAHFLCLDESKYQGSLEALKYVVTPPLRSKEHAEALWAGLRSGVLNTIGSDHCAFPFKDKVRLFETRGSKFTMIPHGAPGIETRIPMLFSEGVSQGRISLSKFVELTAANPARLAGIYPRKGTIAPGSDGDIVIIDPLKEATLTNAGLHGKTDYTPFEGWKVKGLPVITISRGKVLTSNGELVGCAGQGEYLHRGKFIPF
jgi:dihydropyrimidinase